MDSKTSSNQLAQLVSLEVLEQELRLVAGCLVKNLLPLPRAVSSEEVLLNLRVRQLEVFLEDQATRQVEEVFLEIVHNQRRTQGVYSEAKLRLSKLQEVFLDKHRTKTRAQEEVFSGVVLAEEVYLVRVKAHQAGVSLVKTRVLEGFSTSNLRQDSLGNRNSNNLSSQACSSKISNLSLKPKECSLTLPF